MCKTHSLIRPVYTSASLLAEGPLVCFCRIAVRCVLLKPSFKPRFCRAHLLCGAEAPEPLGSGARPDGGLEAYLRTKRVPAGVPRVQRSRRGPLLRVAAGRADVALCGSGLGCSVRRIRRPGHFSLVCMTPHACGCVRHVIHMVFVCHD